MTDSHTIKTIEEVVELVGEVLPTTQAKIVQDLGKIEREFISRCPFVVMSTSGADGVCTVSPKGDAPGFVQVADDRTLLLPERPGNRLIMGYRNLLQNPQIGLLFVIPGSPDTLRVEGRAELTRDPAVLESMAVKCKPALLAIRVSVERCFFHCAKAFIRSKLWQPESWPERFPFSWGEWSKERFGVDDTHAEQVDAAIDADYATNLY